jgi:hypothetical protein
MNKRDSLNLGAIICSVAAVYILYYLLLEDKPFPFSITSVLGGVNHWLRHWHVLVVGLLPVYLALMVFGTSMMGLYVGGALQRWLTHFLHHK